MSQAMSGPGWIPREPAAPPAAPQPARSGEYMKAAEESFPGWEFTRLFGVVIAVPKGTPLIFSSDLDGVVEKLREREGA